MVNKPRIFVGSSTKNLPLARAVQANLQHEADVEVWNQGTFPIADYALDSLVQKLKDSEWGVFICAPDDCLVSEEVTYQAVRDNVLFELGMAIGILGRKRSFMLIPRGRNDLRIPTDLRGFGAADYDPVLATIKPRVALEPACGQIRQAIVDAAASDSTPMPDPVLSALSSPVMSVRKSKGIVSPKEIDESRERLPGEVFAVELLKHPVIIERKENGQVSVTINRRDVEEVVISNAGKSDACRKYVTTENRAALQKRDWEIQDFLAGSQTKKETIDLPNLETRLRWASGGVLSVVRIAGDQSGKRWVPLFFRDIRPYGWNIALGAPERWFREDDTLITDYSRNRELNAPWNYISREFIEESLLVAGSPSLGGELPLKQFKFSRAGAAAEPVAHASDFDKEHRQYRKREDDLTINAVNASTVTVDLMDTKCKVLVDEGRGEPPETEHVLVCFSLLDLGIEVVRVAEYVIESTDYLLDGEILVDNEKGIKELIRMPIALVSLDYLKKTFSGNNDWHRYTLGPQPSIEVPIAPDPKKEEISVFTWDAERRMAVVNGLWGDEWQSKRFVGWYEKFGNNFVDSNGKALRNPPNPSRLFVPGTAKILNLFCSNL